MHIEVLCTGDELLTGITSDTNSAHFMGKLLVLGERVRRATVVADSKADIVEALTTLSQRAEVVLVSGGLGPTTDDLTAEAAAEAAGVPLVEDAETLRRLRERFAERGITLTPNNIRQARVPQGSEVIQNPAGTAPMFTLRIGGCQFFFVAGVPREYRALVDGEVLPRIEQMLAQRADRTYRALRILRTVGLPESHLDAQVSPLFTLHPNVVFGFRTLAPENHLELLAQGHSQEQADGRLAAAERDCRRVLGLSCFGTDDESLTEVVGRLFKQTGQTVGVAESCTGGGLGTLLSEPPGASRYFLGGAITYVDEVKHRALQVPSELLQAEGAVSEPVALAMARGARVLCQSHFGVGITGYAGPASGEERHPVGTVFIALAWPGGERCERTQFVGDRERVRRFAAYKALDMLRRQILERPTS